MYRLADEQLGGYCLTIRMRKEDNVRRGFFERAQFDTVLAQLPEALKPEMHTAYMTGWRLGHGRARRGYPSRRGMRGQRSSPNERGGAGRPAGTTLHQGRPHLCASQTSPSSHSASLGCVRIGIHGSPLRQAAMHATANEWIVLPYLAPGTIVEFLKE